MATSTTPFAAGFADQVEAVSPYLDLWSRPPLLTSYVNRFYEEIPTKTTLEHGTGQVQFCIPGSPSLYTDLNSTVIEFTIRIRNTDGTKVVPSAAKVSTANNICSSIIKGLDHFMNDIRVSSSYNNYAYNAFINNFLSPAANKKALRLAGYIEDKLDSKAIAEDEAIDGPNTSLKNRINLFNADGIGTFIDKIHCPAHTSRKLYLPFITFDYNFTLQSDKFFLIYSGKEGTGTYTYSVLGAKIYAARCVLAPSISIAHSQLLSTNRAAYQVQRMHTSSFTVTNLSQSFIKTNLFLGDAMPKVLMVMMAEVDAVNGNATKNPFVFPNWGLSSIRLRVGEHTIPNFAFSLDYTKNQYKSLYMTSLEALGVLKGDSALPEDFTMEVFKETMNIMMFNLCRDGNTQADYYNSYYDQNAISIEGYFSQPLRTNLMVMVVGIYLSTIEIDSNYVPSTDF